MLSSIKSHLFCGKNLFISLLNSVLLSEKGAGEENGSFKRLEIYHKSNQSLGEFRPFIALSLAILSEVNFATYRAG